MSLMTYVLIIYAAGFVAIQIGVHISLRSEPTAHGQIVGRQVGCAVSLLWPIALIYAALLGVVYAMVWLGRDR